MISQGFPALEILKIGCKYLKRAVRKMDQKFLY